MKKRIIIIGMLAASILIGISFATAVSTNTTPVENKESPLYKIRTIRANNDEISMPTNNIKENFLQNRINLIFQSSGLTSGTRTKTMTGPLSGCTLFISCLLPGAPRWLCFLPIKDSPTNLGLSEYI